MDTLDSHTRQPVKILFFSHDGKLGDAVVNTAFVAALKRWDPHCEIHVTAAGATLAFWTADQRIAKVWPLAKRSWGNIIRLGLALRRERLGHIVTWLRPRSEKNRVLLALAAPRQVVDLRAFNAGPARPRIDACSAALTQIGVPPTSLAYDVHLSFLGLGSDAGNLEDSPYILVNLFAADSERNIEQEAGVRLLRKLNAAMPDAALRVLCSAASVERARAVVDAAGIGEIVNCEGELAHLFGVCRFADAVVSTDTAVVHIAGAFNTPVVGIYQNDGVKPLQWGPCGTATAVVLSASAQDVHGFDVDEVVGHVLALRRSAGRYKNKCISHMVRASNGVGS